MDAYLEKHTKIWWLHIICLPYFVWLLPVGMKRVVDFFLRPYLIRASFSMLWNPGSILPKLASRLIQWEWQGSSNSSCILNCISDGQCSTYHQTYINIWKGTWSSGILLLVAHQEREVEAHMTNMSLIRGIGSIANRWRELHGMNYWKGLLDPLDLDLRRTIINYGELSRAAYTGLNREKRSR